jgi:hypothetical protein
LEQRKSQRIFLLLLNIAIVHPAQASMKLEMDASINKNKNLFPLQLLDLLQEIFSEELLELTNKPIQTKT